MIAPAGLIPPTTENAGTCVLIVNENQVELQALKSEIEALGLGPVAVTADASQAMTLYRECAPDLVLFGLDMKAADANLAISRITRDTQAEQFVPVVATSRTTSSAVARRALAAGACEVSRHGNPARLAAHVRNLLRMRGRTVRLERDVADARSRSTMSEFAFMKRLAAHAEPSTGEGSHIERVGQVSAAIAQVLGFHPDIVALMASAAQLHDVGKLAVPAAIQQKADALTDDERDVIKLHTVVGARILGRSRSPVLAVAAKIALYHHEHWDGTGYTRGLMGEHIPMVARIVAVADSFDVLTHERGNDKAKALAWLASMRGQRFDANVVDAHAAVIQNTGRSDRTEVLRRLNQTAQTSHTRPLPF